MAKPKKAAQQLHRVDRKVAQQASKAKDTPTMRAAAVVAGLGDQPPMIALSGAVLAIGLVLRRRDAAEAGARMLASHLLATAIKNVVKHRIDRTRPQAVAEGEAYTLTTGDDEAHDFTSFPSGHTAGAVAVARAAGRVWPGGAPVLTAAAAGIGALQLPTGKHYGSDVAAGAVIGLASEALIDRIVRAILARGSK